MPADYRIQVADDDSRGCRSLVPREGATHSAQMDGFQDRVQFALRRKSWQPGALDAVDDNNAIVVSSSCEMDAVAVVRAGQQGGCHTLATVTNRYHFD